MYTISPSNYTKSTPKDQYVSACKNQQCIGNRQILGCTCTDLKDDNTNLHMLVPGILKGNGENELFLMA